MSEQQNGEVDVSKIAPHLRIPSEPEAFTRYLEDVWNIPDREELTSNMEKQNELDDGADSADVQTAMLYLTVLLQTEPVVC